MNLIEGKRIAATVETELKLALAGHSWRPGLAVIQVGDNPASGIYVRRKQEACERVGFHSQLIHLPAESQESDLLDVLNRLNHDPQIHGILVQMPLPRHIRSHVVIEAIAPEKDVDGFHPVNGGRLLAGLPGLVPCTPLGIMRLLADYHVKLAGTQAVVIGRSNIVGKPMGLLLLQAHASVSLLHSQTADLAHYTRQADLIIVAVGKPKVLNGDMVKPGVVVIDVGMNRSPENKLVGDVDYESVAPLSSLITPVPGGVGPMTIAMLLQNTWQAAQQQHALLGP